MIKLIGGELWQWDLDRQIEVPEGVAEVHFGCCLGNDALVVAVEDGVATIPNKLLQRSLDIKVWYSDGRRTMTEVVLDVNPRNKPADYLHVEGVSEEQIARAVEQYMEKHPVTVEESDPTVSEWAKQPTKPTYTASEVGALPSNTTVPTKTSQLTDDVGFAKQKDLEGKLDSSKLGEAVNEALAQAKESGEFNGKDGQDGQDGYTPRKGVDYFDGKDGLDGKTPQKGTDYFTEADKQAFVTDVINALPTWQGGSY